MFGGFAVAATVTILLVLPTGTFAGSTQYTQMDSGPIGPADRDLLVRVRQAGLWEIPVGQWAQTRGESPSVKEAGRQMVSDHTKLDAATRALAAKLKVPIPDVASADQQSWMAQLSAEKGSAFDKDFAALLRAAHGKVFAVVANVRAGTRNDEIRKFANTANTVVLKHMTLLEATGLVDYGELPEPPTPTPVPPVATTAADTRRQ